jgi:hypothetical protein
MRTLKLSLSLLAAATVLGPLAALSAYAATILAAAMVAPWRGDRTAFGAWNGSEMRHSADCGLGGLAGLDEGDTLMTVPGVAPPPLPVRYCFVILSTRWPLPPIRVFEACGGHGSVMWTTLLCASASPAEDVIVSLCFR